MVKPLRADAERNRRRVLEVADKVFTEEGLGVPIDEIARRAELGVGTLYRHFPTKEALFTAILVRRVEQTMADAIALLERDPEGDEVLMFLANLAAGSGRKKDFFDALASAGADLTEYGKLKQECHVHLDKLLGRAQDRGSIRRDVTMKEIFALMAGTCGALETHGIAMEERTRMMSILFDGLRPPRGA